MGRSLSCSDTSHSPWISCPLQQVLCHPPELVGQSSSCSSTALGDCCDFPGPSAQCQCCCCASLSWGKCSLQSAAVIDVYGIFVKCHLLGVSQCSYWWYAFFLVWQFFLVNLFLIKNKTKQNVFLHMPPSMELSVICLYTCQGYTIGDKDPKCDTIITEFGSVKGMGSVPLVNSSLWHIGILMMFYFGLRTFSAWIFVNTGMKHWDFEDKWCVLS